MRPARSRARARRQKTLNENGPTDEEIIEVFDFAERKSVDIDKVPFTLNSIDVIGFGGATYPFKIDFTNHGFEFKGTVDDTTYNMWVAPADTDTTDLEAKIIEYGFNIVDYDDAADA